MHAPVLAIPNFERDFTIETDASDVAVGAVLMQDGHPVAYLSKSLNAAQRNYHTTDRELLAIVTACKHWRPYLDGRKTVVITDHKPLVALFTQPDLNKRQVRWLEALSDTPIEIQYRPGQDAVVPDALSRLPTCMGPADPVDAAPAAPAVAAYPAATPEPSASIAAVATDQPLPILPVS